MGKVYELRNYLVNSLYCYGKAKPTLKPNSNKLKAVTSYLNKYKDFQDKYYGMC